jgi:hypothetical protein
MSPLGYAAARKVAERVLPRFGNGAPAPCPEVIEALVDAAFWASLRREEGFSPKISLTYLPPDNAGMSIRFERPLPLSAEMLGKMSPAVERPGIHLGVWREGDELRVWGATRAVPAFGFVLEVVAPGLLVIKRRRSEAPLKFENIAVLEGDRVKVLDAEATLLGFDGPQAEEPVNVLVELAVSMRAHGRGGTLLVVPSTGDGWRQSIIHPMQYAVSPAYSKLSVLMRKPDRDSQPWQDAFHRTIESIAGLTSVDGATVISDLYDVLAFGAKIRRAEGLPMLEQVLLTEPVEGAIAQRVTPMETGGTRHMSAAQFAYDQRDALALVASQDGRFTAYAWSEEDEMVRAMRVESVLL